MHYPGRKIWQNSLAVITGAAVAIVISIPSLLAGALLLFSDERLPSSQVIAGYGLMKAGIIAGCLAGGFVCAKISVEKTVANSIPAALILLFLDLLINDFDPGVYDLAETLFLAVILPATLLGAYIQVKRHRKNRA